MRDWEDFVRGHLELPQLLPEREQRIVRELAAMLEDAAADARRAGLSPDEAETRMTSLIGDWTSLASDIQRADRPHRRPRLQTLQDRIDARPTGRAGRWTMLSRIPQDLLFALRMMRKRPFFTAAAILTLALAIGANTAIFSAVHGILLEPFPYPHPDRLGVVYTQWSPTSDVFWMSEQEVQDLRDQSQLFQGFASLLYGSATLLEGGDPMRLTVGMVSANLFSLLELQPAVGGFFSPDADVPGTPVQAILSHELWRTRFGGDPDIVDREIRFDSDTPVRVAGVLPEGFRLHVPKRTNFPARIDLWYPYQVDYRSGQRGNRNITTLAKLKPGATWSQAQAELDRIAASLREEFYPSDSEVTFPAFPLHSDTVREIRPTLLILLAASGLVLLIACVNIANFLLARGATRVKEFAIRTALGAGRGRLMSQSLIESLVLAIIGGAAGILLAWAGVRVLSAYLPSKLPRLDAIQIDAVVLGASTAVSLVAGFFSGVVPALRSARSDVNRSLKEGARGQTGSLRVRLRSILVVSEIALSLMLLIGGILIVRSFLNLQQIQLGYDPSDTLTFTVGLPSKRYPDDEARYRFFRTLQERIQGMAGVQSVSGNVLLPFGRFLWIPSFTFYHPGDDPSAEPQVISALARPALPGYFHTLRTPIAEGRDFEARDTSDSERVAIIDETLASRLWPDSSAIGKRLARGSLPKEPAYATIIGVVPNLCLTTLTGGRPGQVYWPAGQGSPGSISYAVRSRVPPQSLLKPIQAEVAALDPNLALDEIALLKDTVSEVMAPQRMTSVLMVAFALIGLTIALVGVYAVISYTVNLRTYEIGLRFALGARPWDVYKNVVGHGMRLAALGILLGLAGTAALAGTLRSLLFGVSATDPSSYAAVSLALLATASLACLLPARRAARVDPLAALHHE